MKNLILIFICTLCTLSAMPQHALDRFVFDAPGVDEGLASFEGADGGTVLFGNTNSYHFGIGKPWMIGLDSTDQLLFRKTFNTYHYQNERINSVVKASYGNFILVGSVLINSTYNILVMAVDPSGNILWVRNYGGLNWDFARDVVQISDNDFVICGETYNNAVGGSDGFLLRIDAQGDSLAYHRFGDADMDEPKCIAYTFDSTLVVSGSTKSYGNGSKDLFLLEADEQLNSLRFYHYPSDYDREAMDILQIIDSSYVLAGCKKDSIGDQRNLLEKVDRQGNLLWNHKSKQASRLECIYAVVQNPYDEHFFTTGQTNMHGNGGADIILNKNDHSGYYQFGYTYGGSKDDVGYHLRMDTNKILHITGTTHNFGSSQGALFYLRTDTLLQTSSNSPSFISVDLSEAQNEVLPEIYPNPCSDVLHISLPTDYNGKDCTVEIWGIDGRKHISHITKGATKNLQLPLNGLAEGLYIVVLNSETRRFTSKVLVLD